VAGERIAVIAHSPFPWTGPYAEVGPVFVHAEECGGYAGGDRWPAAYRHRPQVLRAYGSGHSIRSARVAGPAEVDTALDELVGDDEVECVHATSGTAPGR